MSEAAFGVPGYTYPPPVVSRGELRAERARALKVYRGLGGRVGLKKKGKKKTTRRRRTTSRGRRGFTWSVPNATVSGIGAYRQPRYTQARRSKPRTSQMGTKWGETLGDAISGFIPGIGGTIAKGPLHALG